MKGFRITVLCFHTLQSMKLTTVALRQYNGKFINHYNDYISDSLSYNLDCGFLDQRNLYKKHLLVYNIYHRVQTLIAPK